MVRGKYLRLQGQPPHDPGSRTPSALTAGQLALKFNCVCPALYGRLF